ncbi:hypothetical protein [Streptomyces sp. NBC_01233]|uniref:hypothetical protein n=1 Tax=Streptomyces sp. NBC_01233 TaxID=2903787 RepID=UPI002E142D79|nr:hypothetical protein OG332_32385 [Streptomyces sp. NBC_01233]
MPLRARVLAPAAVVVAAAAVAVLLAGCSQTPAEELEDWYSSGGESRIKQLNESVGRVDEVSMRTLDVQGPACQDLLKEVTAAERLGPIPREAAQGYGKESLDGFRRGTEECVAGAAKGDELQSRQAGERRVDDQGRPVAEVSGPSRARRSRRR